MKSARKRRPWLLLAVAAALGVAPAAAQSADEAAEAAEAAEPALALDAEDEAYKLLESGKLITARARAEEALARDPGSIRANYVMGMVLYMGEGILPRAMVHLARARRAFEERYGEYPGKEAPWSFHKLILQSMQGLAGEMEQFDEQLRLQDRYDALYEPDMHGERAWALLQKGLFDDARRSARRAIDSGDLWERSIGLNALCAIESETRTRQAQYEACLASLLDARGSPEQIAQGAAADAGDLVSITVDAFNAASAAYSVLRFEEVEKFALLATNSPDVTVANPWRMLVGLYTSEGRLAEAVSAAREMQRWRMRLPASLRDQDRAETDARLASLLLIFGEAEAGHRLITRALERPDRRGLVSSKHEQAAGMYALIRRALSMTKSEIAVERASFSELGDRAKSALDAGRSLAEQAIDGARITGVVAEEARLNATLRIHLSGGIEGPTWLLGDLVGVLGAGVVGAELDIIRREEAGMPALAAFYDALSAEVALARGDEGRAAELARRAVAALPQAEALMKARAAAVGGEALRRRGDVAGALALFQRALETDAGIIRRLGLALPAAIKVEGGGEAARALAEMLGRSPRFVHDPNGFVVAIDKPGAAHRACLRAPDGASLACAEVAAKPGEAPKEHAARLAAAFHRGAFSPRVTLTTGDLGSLDGSNTLAGQAQRERMQEVLREMAQDPSGNR
jgi:hypothetical protein